MDNGAALHLENLKDLRSHAQKDESLWNKALGVLEILVHVLLGRPEPYENSHELILLLSGIKKMW